ncbi:MFS general substrate transporter [Aulographum hederae CBS 113979]|uniref:MFS general substrate transporter n=1 Tax=Aulographum hederae CBS 113979 TaxID=1176131 RepID=A0A6G1GNG6_9PEZI|nr:MFS general substrate transporter [Aulographum hederae CBS 113979]
MSRPSSSHNGQEKPPENVAQAVTPVKEVETFEYPSNKSRIFIMTALYLAAFLVTLDQNIISTAIPRITDEFHSLDDVGWYGTAYILTMCSFQLLMGKVYKFYPAKPVFLGCCLMFEIGSAICGAAPNSKAFIIGRAIAGLGSSGLFSGLMVILFYTIPLQQRPIYQGAFGAVFAVASVIGPLVGGSFTDKVTWRWCFYINLPVGAVSMVVTMFLLRMPNQKLDERAEGWMGKVKQLDPIGNLVFFPGIICLVLALQWGGTEYSWNNARIIVLFVLFGVLCLLFMAIQAWKKEEATVPPRILKQRSIAAATIFAFFNGAGMMVMIYYLPIWFQAVKGASAIKSGIMLLPTVLSVVIGSIGSGIIISRVGYYTPFFILSSVFTPLGAGLMTTFTPSTGSGKWIGYQILFGFGLGLGSQQPMTVAQTVLSRSDMATGTALVMFIRFLGSAIFLPVGQTIFINGLVSRLTNLPGIHPKAVTGGGALELKNLVSGDDLDTLLRDYSNAIVDVFYMVTATCVVTMFGSVFVEWKSLKARAQEQAATKKTEESGVVEKDRESVDEKNSDVEKAEDIV